MLDSRSIPIGLRNGTRQHMDPETLLREIAEYCRRADLAESTFGRLAINDGKLVRRLRDGGRITTDTFDRIPKDTPWSIERSFFPSLIERRERFCAYVDDGYWIDIGTPEKYMQVHRDIMDGRFRAAPFSGGASSTWISPDARVEQGVTIGPNAVVQGPCSIGPNSIIAPLAMIRAAPYVIETIIDTSL